MRCGAVSGVKKTEGNLTIAFRPEECPLQTTNPNLNK